MGVDAGQLDAGAMIQPERGEWYLLCSELLEEEGTCGLAGSAEIGSITSPRQQPARSYSPTRDRGSLYCILLLY
jgi:hypothetical protein